MTIRKFSHPISHLTLTFLTTLTLTSSLHAVDTQTSRGTRPATQSSVDPNLLPALLPPMSRLIPSPYSDPQVINNPLGIDQTVSAKIDVIKTATVQAVTAHSKSIEESFKTESEPQKVRLPVARDFTINTPLSNSTQTNTLGTLRSLAHTD
jgi:hypothetical protein